MSVSVSVSENLISEKKVPVSVSENLVLTKKSHFREKSLGFGFGEFGLGKKFPSQKIWSSTKSLGFCFGKLGLGKEKIKIKRKKVNQRNNYYF